FVVMAVVLVVRPWGLLGRPEAQARSAGGAITAGRGVGVPRWLIAVLVAVLLVVPPLLPTFYVWVLVEILAFALFAASLHLLMGTGGMVSFGHAAAFGLGAYGAALLVRWAKAPMLVALAAAPVTAALAAVVIGFFCVRLSSIYFAMLTLAFAQIAYAIVHQWYDVAGGAGLGGAARDGAAGGRALAGGRAARRRALQAARHRGDALHGILAARARRHPRGPGACVSARDPRRAGGARAWLSAPPSWRSRTSGARSAGCARSTACRSPSSAARSAPSSAPTAPASQPSSTSSRVSSAPTRARCAGAVVPSAGCRRTRSGAWASAAPSRSRPRSRRSPSSRTCRSRGCRTRVGAACC